MRFSLRALLVVVSVLGPLIGWLVVIIREDSADRVWATPPYRFNGSELAKVRTRQQVLQEISRGGGCAHKSEELDPISEVRKQLGDRARSFIFIPDDHFTPADVDRIKKAFPEAEVNYTSREHVEHVRREARED